jgi:hypothetical protein
MSAHVIGFTAIGVNYLIQLSFLKRFLNQEQMMQMWFSLIPYTILEHFLFIGVILLGLRMSIFSSTMFSNRVITTFYTALAFPEIGKICAIMDCEPALLLFIGSLTLSIQLRSLGSLLTANNKAPPRRLLHILFVFGVLFKHYFRQYVLKNDNLGYWWMLI